jgi:enoyl-CoA hydratase/carnithine racemase
MDMTTTTMPQDPPQPTVLVQRRPIEGGSGLAGWVTMNRPDSMNPMDWDTIRAIAAGLDELASDERVRVIFVTGEGRAFSAGGDMKRYVDLQKDPVAFPEFVADCHRMFARIPTYAQPVVALVNGVSVAGGTELIMFCDFAIAARTARIGDAHLNFGMMGGGGVLAMLPMVVGAARARELVLTGRMLSAEEAREWGLVSRVVEPEELEATANELALLFSGKSPLALKNAKSVINSGLWSGADMRTKMDLEREVDLRYCLTSEDAQEGLRAFGEKRAPQFTGR